MKNVFWIMTLAVSGILLIPSVDRQLQAQEAKEVPEGFQQLLPRGGIPAIDNPQYVTADKARISDRAYVFGVVIEGQPVAYSLNLLNSHEVVNDTIGKTNFAAVW